MQPSTLGGLCLAILWDCGGGPPSVERILLITIDTLRADHVGCYGAQNARTSQLDTVADRGVRFEVAISPAPLTLPAHASLMTGLDPPGHGVRHNGLHRLAEEIPTLSSQLRNAGYQTGAFVGAFVLDRRFGLARGFDVYDDAMNERSSPTVGYAERPADAVVDAAIAWLGQADARFFLWVHLYDPHAAYDPPAGFRAAFANDPYAGEIAFADAQLGRLLDAVRQRFGDAGQLVVVTSDHGESLGEHGELSHSYSLYDATQRVPLLIAGEGWPAGRLIDTPVRLVDVAPTLLAAAGAAPLPGIEGADLRPLLAGGASGVPSAYLETLATHLDFGWSALFGLRTADWKYVRAPRPELYDLRADGEELRDVASLHPERVAALDAELARRMSGARPTTPVTLGEAERERLRSLGYLQGDPQGAVTDLGGPDPKDEIGLLPQLARAEELADRGRHADALRLLRDLDASPPAVAALRAAVAFNAGDLTTAEQDARSVLRAQPGREDVRGILRRVLASREEPESPLPAGVQKPIVEVDPGL